MSTSTHQVEVVPVQLDPHPNADALSIVRVRGFTVCVRTADWQGVERGAYIQPDSIVPDTPDFAFLGDKKRIKVKKLRGVVSMGLLVRAPDGASIGDDVAELLGVTHYEPPMRCDTGGETAPAPKGYAPVYDVESARRYAQEVLAPGEPIIATEKIHGANGRWLWDGERFHAGSRTEWKVETAGNVWWQALYGCAELQDWLRAHPGHVIYGEVYGKVQDLRYGVENGVRLAVFDILRGSEWVDAREARTIGSGLPWVPTLYEGPYDWAHVETLAEGPSLIPGANHIREGCVIKPLAERTHFALGRVCLKVVGSGYLERP